MRGCAQSAEQRSHSGIGQGTPNRSGARLRCRHPAKVAGRVGALLSMFGLGPATRIYLAAGATDMRKGFDGLYGSRQVQIAELIASKVSTDRGAVTTSSSAIFRRPKRSLSFVPALYVGEYSDVRMSPSLAGPKSRISTSMGWGPSSSQCLRAGGHHHGVRDEDAER